MCVRMGTQPKNIDRLPLSHPPLLSDICALPHYRCHGWEEHKPTSTKSCHCCFPIYHSITDKGHLTSVQHAQGMKTAFQQACPGFPEAKRWQTILFTLPISLEQLALHVLARLKGVSYV